MLRGPVRALFLLLAVLLGCGSAACGGPAGGPREDAAGLAIRRAVADWSARPPAALAALPLEGWTYEVTSVRRDGVRASAAARLRYRLAGYDAAPAGSDRSLALSEDGGRWKVTGDRPAAGAPPQLWDQGPVTVVRGEHVLVLGGAGRSRAELEAVAGVAGRTVPEVSAAWPRPWAGRVVVVVPGSLDAMAALLGRPVDAYRGLAAVTTALVGAAPAPADRVVVNPQAYGELSEEGRQVVLTHESTHVATRSATTDTTPLWLSEGFADWAAYRSAGRTPAQAAPALRRAVGRGELPSALPSNEEFTFGGDAQALARAYEGAWLACRLIADRWGEAALVRLYESAGRTALPMALRTTLDTDLPHLTQTWQSTLRKELR
ncbi:hypothetical protein [Streptomyces sp. G-G2]|uniref:hypothetical protein n=1 Tax=Streptomyces sp. G-G2 TaxID=3046201 RepID=UPI0024BA580B|nr:hypothetical protein [Streptomyces sp. G-G2]MDJ0383325.1 hypothetical protein [Streptomyces sp. G-G2]